MTDELAPLPSCNCFAIGSSGQEGSQGLREDGRKGGGGGGVSRAMYLCAGPRWMSVNGAG